MKRVELERVPKDRIGRIDMNGVKAEPHEESTALHLAQYGFDIEFIRPRNSYKTNSADFLISGAVWETKSPITFKESTLKDDFRKAKAQSDRIIFDLRRVKKYVDDVEKYIISIFEKPGYAQKLIIIRKNGTVIVFSK